MISVYGSRPPLDLSGWRRIARQFQTVAGVISVPATTTQTVATTGLVLKWQVGQAIFIRRYVGGASPGLAGANFIVYFHGSLELQTGVQPFTIGSGNVSNDTEIITAAPSATLANAQTLSDMSITGMLRDDWHEFDDYFTGPNPAIGVGLGLQCFFRLRNVDAAAHNVNVVDSVLYEVWQSRESLGLSPT